MITIALLALVTAGCTGIPDGIKSVDQFDLNQYLGTWYEIARLDHRFERGLESVTATYSMREDGGIRVENRGYNAEDAEWSTAIGKAYPIENTTGRLKVSFFGPFYGGYNVIELGDNYEYSVVAGPDRDFLWILSRTPKMEQGKLDAIVARLEAMKFDTKALIYPDHSKVWRQNPGN